MCAIFCSFDTYKLHELANLNSYRGQHSYSVAYFTKLGHLVTITRGLGSWPSTVTIPEGCFAVCHIQAPTTEVRTMDSVHPAMRRDQLLWHNGIIKAKQIEKFQDLQSTDEKWDTPLVLEHLIETGSANDIDGSFSCIWHQGNSLYHFRNQISPMFSDDDFNWSSTKFEGSESTLPDIMWKLNLDTKTVEAVGTFKTVNNPYYFG